MRALRARALRARPFSHSKRARRDRHLTCTKCREQWCWQCGSWGGGPSKRPPPHHVHDCNSPPDADWVKDGGKLFDNDGRFMFYYERFQNHADAMRLAEQQRESARERVRKLEAERDADQTAMELAYISDAVALVIECRRTLQWTYAHAFFEADDARRRLFEFLQRDFEVMTEQLSGLTEKPLPELRAARQEIVHKTAALRQFLENIIQSQPVESEPDDPGSITDWSALLR